MREPQAWQYIRFSTPEQEEGRSIPRQTETGLAWSKRTGIPLPASHVFIDKGTSAHKGEHRQRDHALGKILDRIADGRIQPGDFVLFENLDRLSRERPVTAGRLAFTMLDNGINLVQLVPVEMTLTEEADFAHLTMMLAELCRGHGESARKVGLSGDVWQNKKEEARLKKTPVSKRGPAWLKLVDGKWEELPDAVKAVRRMFELAQRGYGVDGIIGKLYAEGHKPIARSKVWRRGYVGAILKGRAVLGEYQPQKGKGANREPDGEPIPGYWPAIIDEDTFRAARASIEGRKVRPGRKPQAGVNVFVGLLHDARGGGNISIVSSMPNDGGRHLAPSLARERVPGSKYVSFPFMSFERSIFEMLREVAPVDVLGPDSGHEEVERLKTERGRVRVRIAEFEAALKEGEVAAAVRELRALVKKEHELTEQMAAAKLKADHPLSDSLEEAQSLLTALDNAPDPEDARLRLREALNDIVEGIWCLFVRKGVRSLAAVQVRFHGGQRRDYLILHRRATGGSVRAQPACCWVCSLADEVEADDLDLRQRDHAAALEQRLMEKDVRALEQRLEARVQAARASENG